ncbi:PREDICTED: protein G12 [Wasmannia auropunctata]|uniref:protein G12 n=1 Tax=Wasmannia auropunctata TaxID=64793 RepID=UPI0005F05FEC|nr:PREDICTED: protein G12 [Wasmannia auropunctata]
MKFALVLLAFVAAASAKIEIPNFGRGELHKDIQEFLDMMPVDQIMSITLQYYAQDAEFQKMVEYFQSEGFKQLVKDVEALPEIKTLMDYIHEAGIDIYKIVNILNNALGLPPLTPPPSFFMGTQITGGIRGFVDDILAIVPKQQLQDLYEKKLETSEAFRNFVKQLESENFQQIVNKVYNHPKCQELLNHARNAGIDLLVIKDLLEILWGIRIPTY